MSYQGISTNQEEAARRAQLLANVILDAGLPLGQPHPSRATSYMAYDEGEKRILEIRDRVVRERLSIWAPGLKTAIADLLRRVKNARKVWIVDAEIEAAAPVIDYEEGEELQESLLKLLSLRKTTRRADTHEPDPVALTVAMKKLDNNIKSARTTAWTLEASRMTIGRRDSEADNALNNAAAFDGEAGALDQLALTAENKSQCEEGLLPTTKMTCIGGCGANHTVVTSEMEAVCHPPTLGPTSITPIPNETIGYNAVLASAPYKIQAAELRRKAAAQREYASIMNDSRWVERSDGKGAILMDRAEAATAALAGRGGPRQE